MLRLRNWRIKYEGVQDTVLKLYPASTLIYIGYNIFSVTFCEALNIFLLIFYFSSDFNVNIH